MIDCGDIYNRCPYFHAELCFDVLRIRVISTYLAGGGFVG